MASDRKTEGAFQRSKSMKRKWRRDVNMLPTMRARSQRGHDQVMREMKNPGGFKLGSDG